MIENRYTVQSAISQTFRFGDPQCSISSIIFALKPYNGLNESIFQGDYLAWKKYSDFIFCHLVAPKQILHGGQNPLRNGRRFAKWGLRNGRLDCILCPISFRVMGV